MPWTHCGTQITDDRPCPWCGFTKENWTVHLNGTRHLRLGGKPDEERQAEALLEAAREGTPFCEACEKERQRRATTRA